MASLLEVTYRRQPVAARGVLLLVGLVALGEVTGGSTPQGPSPKLIAVDVAPGAVLLDVLEAGHPEHYWQYQVQPSSGAIQTVLKADFKDYSAENIPKTYQQPAGAGGCIEHPFVPSPDGRFIAQCGSGGIQIKDQSASTIIYTWKTGEGGDIRGIAWSPSSRSLAVLNISERLGKSPIELLSALSGHPVPHNTVFLDFINFESASVTEYLIQADVVSAFCRILDWSHK